MSTDESQPGGAVPEGNGEAPARAAERRLFAGLLATRSLPVVNEPPAQADPDRDGEAPEGPSPGDTEPAGRGDL